jgi:hypothetical protein
MYDVCNVLTAFTGPTATRLGLKVPKKEELDTCAALSFANNAAVAVMLLALSATGST